MPISRNDQSLHHLMSLASLSLVGATSTRCSRRLGGRCELGISVSTTLAPFGSFATHWALASARGKELKTFAFKVTGITAVFLLPLIGGVENFGYGFRRKR